MGWNATTKRVTAPVSIRTFQRAFGIFSTKVLHRIVKLAAAAGLINKWAKYKPVEYSGWSTVGELNTLSSNHASWNWRQSSDWWRGDSGTCGLNIQVFENFGAIDTQGSFLYKLTHGELPWDYVPPTQKFRMFDLIHYYADAIKPMGDTLEVTDFWLSTQGQLEFSFDVQTVDTDNLTLGDIRIGGRTGTPLSQFYLGMVLFEGTRVWILTSTSQLGSQSATITIQDASSLAGQWYAVPFLSNKVIAINDQLTTGKYMSFDSLPQLVTIHAAGTIIDIWVFASWNAAGTAIEWELVMDSDLTADRTLTNVIVYLYSTADPDDDPETGSLVAQTTPISVTVPAKSRVSRTGTISGVTKSSALTYWIGADTDGDFAINYNQVEDDASILPST